MATRLQRKLSLQDRQRRQFSDSFKLKKVREIETGKTKITDICREYEVSNTSVYKWINKYGLMKEKKERLIIESESDTKQLISLKKRIAELERLVGQKQIQIEFKDKMIEIAEDLYGIDIKKKLSSERLNTSGKTGKDSPLV